MGMNNNECVIATTHSDESIQKVKEWIASLDEEYQKLFALVPSIMNRETTVFMGPSGSKKRWATDKEVEGIRDRFIALLVAINGFSWVEVGFGEFGQTILGGNNVNCYDDEDYYRGN